MKSPDILQTSWVSGPGVYNTEDDSADFYLVINWSKPTAATTSLQALNKSCESSGDAVTTERLVFWRHGVLGTFGPQQQTIPTHTRQQWLRTREESTELRGKTMEVIFSSKRRQQKVETKTLSNTFPDWADLLPKNKVTLTSREPDDHPKRSHLSWVLFLRSKVYSDHMVTLASR